MTVSRIWSRDVPFQGLYAANRTGAQPLHITSVRTRTATLVVVRRASGRCGRSTRLMHMRDGADQFRQGDRLNASREAENAGAPISGGGMGARWLARLRYQRDRRNAAPDCRAHPRSALESIDRRRAG